jgi:glycosyltransferase involved in cell wall biosynthesis
VAGVGPANFKGYWDNHMSLSILAPRSRRVVVQFDRSPRIVNCDERAFRSRTPPDGADAAIILLPGESMLQGTEASLRHRLRHPGEVRLPIRREPGVQLQIPVHYPALPLLGLDLIGLEPRAFNKPPHRQEIAADLRIGAAPDPSRAFAYALRDNKAPWARLSVVLAEASADIQAAIDRLGGLWQRETTPPLLRSLILRNLVVLLIKQGNHDKARELLDLGMQAFPEYAELRYISAVHWLQCQKFTAALNEAKLVSNLTPRWIGSGGESTHRAAWIMGACSAVAGDQRLALSYFLPGLCARPALQPAVESLLDLRLSLQVSDRLTLALGHLARREPKYLHPVIEYLILHRCFSTARNLAATLPLSTETRDTLTARITVAESPFTAEVADQPTTSRLSSSPDSPANGVMIQAPFFQLSSLGGIARKLAAGLLADSNLDVCLEPRGYGTQAEREVPNGATLSRMMLHHPRKLGLTIRTCWPPDLRRPPRGKLAVIFPWEYQGVPRYWISQMRENVDEVWTPSRWVAGVLERAGLERQRIRVIPSGIAPDVFTPDGPQLLNPEARGFVFLFVGGAIARKGFDLLLDAYEEAFTSRDEVTLWIKESGSASFYAHNSMLSLTRRFHPESRLPHLMLNTKTVDEATLAGMYRRADCLVHPYRGEGFGLPMAEAMACGTPVITTAEGPAPEFCSEETGWLIPATGGLVPDDPPPVGELSEPLKWFEPRFDELVRAMRDAYENRDETKRRGSVAAQRIRTTHAWPRIIEQYAQAIREVVGEPVLA